MLGGLQNLAVAEQSFEGGFFPIRKEMYMQADSFSFHEHRKQFNSFHSISFQLNSMT